MNAERLRAEDAVRVAIGHIRETAVFFVANIIATSVGILLVVVMLSMSVGLSRYVERLMRGDVSATLIEVTVDPHAGDVRPLTFDNVQRFETVPYVEAVVPAVTSVFAELQSGKNNAFISLASPEGTPASAPADAGASSLPLPGAAARDAAASAGATPALRIPLSVARELSIKSGAHVLLHLTRSGGQALDIPATIATLEQRTRFSRCYAPLPLMRQIRRWQETGDFADTNAFIYDNAFVYARAIDDVPSIRKDLEAQGYRTASILDSVRRYRQIMLIAGVVLTSLGLIALFTGSVSIFNAAYAAVMRRMREIAIYKTYGATRAAIMAIVLTEAGITAIVSGILGFAAGGAVCLLLQRLVRAEVDFVLFPIEWWLAVVAFATACLASLAASLIPALRAARLSPTEALRA